METLSIERILKGDPMRANTLQIVPIVRLSGHIVASDTCIFGLGRLEPVGLHVMTEKERYALDLEGHKLETLEEL